MLQLDTVSVPVDDAVCDVLKKNNYLTEIVRIKFDCEAILNSPLNTQSRPTRPQILFEKTLGNKARIKLSVQRDDLRNHHVDAVVNAANEYLQHYGGLALALITAGGIDIQNESDAIIDKKGKIATGDAVFTCSGRLPCKYVLHAVGPECGGVYPHDHTTCRKLLQKAIGSILNSCTKQSDIQSVAIPALSSGIFNFPLEDCAKVIVKTIIDFCDKATSSESLKEIRLVNHDDETVKAMQKACEQIFGRGGSFPGNATRQSPETIKVHKVILQIERGYIENQQTDVIVNSVSEQLNLSEGAISQAILQKAGRELQDEIMKKAQEVKSSPVIKTRGYKLSNFVYHAIVPKAQTSGSDKVLQQAVQICLENANKDGSRSISFPAIGTGVLSFSKRKVASIMTSEVKGFALRNPEKELYVQFVIYPTDNGTFQAFQDELKLLASEKNTWKVDQRSAEAGHHLNNFVNENIEPLPIKPTIQLRGRNHSDVEEAEKWIRNTMQQQHQKCLLVENSLIIYLGADEHNTLITNIDSNVSFVENVKDGSAHMKIEGLGPDVIKAALEIESLLCKVQKQYELKQEEELVQIAELLNDKYDNRRQQYKRIPDVCELKFPIDEYNPQCKNEITEFQKAGLRIVKMESICNEILSVIYQSKKYAVQRKVNDPSMKLYHRVPVQFCNLICRLGFNRIYSRPDEQKYGVGIYFSSSLQSLQQNNKQTQISDKYIYIFKAEVVTGRFTKGKESHIVPPPIGADCMDLYDSVVDDIYKPETFVIFNSYQAIPLILFTCEKII